MNLHFSKNNQPSMHTESPPKLRSGLNMVEKNLKEKASNETKKDKLEAKETTEKDKQSIVDEREYILEQDSRSKAKTLQELIAKTEAEAQNRKLSYRGLKCNYDGKCLVKVSVNGKKDEVNSFFCNHCKTLYTVTWADKDHEFVEEIKVKNLGKWL